MTYLLFIPVCDISYRQPDLYSVTVKIDQPSGVEFVTFFDLLATKLISRALLTRQPINLFHSQIGSTEYQQTPRCSAMNICNYREGNIMRLHSIGSIEVGGFYTALLCPIIILQLSQNIYFKKKEKVFLCVQFRI